MKKLKTPLNSLFSRSILEREKLAHLCENGNLPQVMQYLKDAGLTRKPLLSRFFDMVNRLTDPRPHDDVEKENIKSLNNALRIACQEGHLDIVAYLLTSPELTLKPRIQGGMYEYFNYCISNGHLHVVKYLVQYPQLKPKEDVRVNYNDAFLCACHKGQLEIVKYMLTSPECREKTDIHVANDWCLTLACQAGHLDIVKYLLSSGDLSEHVHMHAVSVSPLAWIFQNNHMDLLTFLLYELKMEVSPMVYESMDKNDAQAFMNLVNKRDLFFKMSETMDVRQDKEKFRPSARPKI